VALRRADLRGVAADHLDDRPGDRALGLDVEADRAVVVVHVEVGLNQILALDAPAPVAVRHEEGHVRRDGQHRATPEGLALAELVALLQLPPAPRIPVRIEELDLDVGARGLVAAEEVAHLGVLALALAEQHPDLDVAVELRQHVPALFAQGVQAAPRPVPPLEVPEAQVVHLGEDEQQQHEVRHAEDSALGPAARRRRVGPAHPSTLRADRTPMLMRRAVRATDASKIR
jgi:hypothetical protein